QSTAAFRESRFAVALVGRARRVPRLSLPWSANSRHGEQAVAAPYRIRFSQLVAVIRSLAPGFLAEKISAPRGRARFPTPGSAAEAIQRFRFEMFALGEDRLLGQERVAVILERVIDLTNAIFLFGADEKFRRRNTREFVKERLSILQLGEPELAGGEVRISKTKYAAVGVNRAQIIRAFCLE